MTAATGTEGLGSLLVGSGQYEPVGEAATVDQSYGAKADLAADDEQHFAATVGMFVRRASRGLAELKVHVCTVVASGQPASAIPSVRQCLHALQVEFGVLDMSAPQQFCQEAEAAVAACASAGVFPADAIRSGLDLLHEFLDRLAGDGKARFGAVEPVLRQLRDFAAGATTTDAALAGPAPLVEMQVVGDFADCMTEFVTAAQRQLALAAAALATIASEPDCLDSIRRAGRAMRAMQRLAGLMNLGPLLELAAAAATLLDARSAPGHWCASDSELMLSAANMTEQLLGALDGKRAPERRQLAQLLSRLRGAATSRAAQTASAAQPAPSIEVVHAARADATTLAPTTVVPGQILSFRLAHLEYGIAVLRVREILGAVDVTPLPGVPDFVLGVIHRRGWPIPVIDLRRRCGMVPGQLERTCMLVVEVATAADHPVRAGCVVDSVGEVLSVGVEPFETTPRGPDAVGDCSAGLVRVRGRELRLLDLERVVAGIDLAALTSGTGGAGS